jgi:tetratricopeptide (TPR) repeat protein
LTALGEVDEAAREAVVAVVAEQARADMQSLLTLSQMLQESGDFAAAESALLQGVEVAPEQSSLWLALAEFYTQQGQIDQAEAAYQKAAVASPDDYQVLLRQIRFYENQARSTGADGSDRYWPSIRDGYRRVIELNPKLMQAYTNLAQGYRARGEHDAALELLATGLKELPDDPWLIFATAQVYNAMRDFEQALPYFQQAVAKRPEDGWFQLNLAHAYRLLQRWDEAVETYNVALQLAPDLLADAAVQNNIGLSALNAQQYDLARSSLERALELRPEFPAAQLFLAQVLEQTGDFTGAKAGYDRVIQLAPDSDFARTAASRLEDLPD